MFQKAKEKRKEIASRLDSFNRFRHTISSDKRDSIISNSAEKRKQIQNSFENWAVPLSRTSFEQRQCDMSMSFRASEFRPKPTEQPHEILNEQSREMLERQFYEDAPDNSKILNDSREDIIVRPVPQKIKESPERSTEKPNDLLVKIVQEVEPIEHVRDQIGKKLETDGIIPSDIILKIEMVTNEPEPVVSPEPIRQDDDPPIRQESDPVKQEIQPILIPSTHLQQPTVEDISIRQSDLIQLAVRQEKVASPKASPQPLAGSNINNSSHGIFFTDDFKQFLNQKHEEAQQPTKPAVEEPKFPESQQTLEKVFSEQINTHLVLSLEDITLLRLEAGQAAKKIAQIAQQKYDEHKKQHIRGVVEALQQTNKLTAFQRRMHLEKMYLYFLHIKLYRQYRENKVKKKIAISRLREKMLTNKVAQIFHLLKGDAKLKRDMNRMIGQGIRAKTLEKSLRGWKLYTFSQRIKKQAVLFRLSGIFNGLKDICHQEKQIKQAKALKFFYRSCLRRGMQLLKMAVMQSEIERQQNRQSYIHHTLGLQRKIFSAWRDTVEEMMDQKMNREYIAVEMTLKDGLQHKGSELIKTRQLLFN